MSGFRNVIYGYYKFGVVQNTIETVLEKRVFCKKYEIYRQHNRLSESPIQLLDAKFDRSALVEFKDQKNVVVAFVHYKKFIWYVHVLNN